MHDEPMLERVAVAALFIGCVALVISIAYWF